MAGLRIHLAALLAAVACLAASARAQAAASFVAEADRGVVAPGETFTYQVTLTVSDESVEGFRPPDFRGLRVVSAAPYPSRSTQMQIGGGQTLVQNGYTWTYQLMLPSSAKGTVTIGAAQARVAGRETRSNPVSLQIGAPGSGAPGAAGARRGGGGQLSFDPFAGLGGPQPSRGAAASSSAGTGFIRAVADKTRVFVGEQVTMTWTLYVAQRPGKFDVVAEPRTDGFWVEELPTANPRGRLQFSQEMVDGRPYFVAPLFKKGLFPLRAGKLAVTPLEAETAEVDFFGGLLRRQRFKAETITLEVVPLPSEEEPAGFRPSNVGSYTLAARAEPTTVPVGVAATVTIEIRGIGNIRNVVPPEIPRLDGWKSYVAKTDVTVDPGDTISGAKTLEVVMLPEREGTAVLPALTMDTFDPATKRYATIKSEPITLVATSEGAAAGARAAPADGATAGKGAAAGRSDVTGVENVIGMEIRPIRARAGLSRDVGTTFLHSPAFLGIVLVPPLALGLWVLAGRLKERLTEESRRARRRVRRMVRRRLAAAEDHRDAGRTVAFYIEIDRVLREMLASRLGQPVGGLRLDELDALLRARGMPPDGAARIVAELEACDRARFAPGQSGSGDGAGATDHGEMTGALDRAEELIVTIERASLGAEGGAT